MSALPLPRAAATRHETLTDEEVVRRILAGEGPLFELVMRRHNQRLYRVARSVLGDDVEAEEALQQAYVNAFSHLGQFEGQAKLATWLTRIVLYESYARARRRTRRRRFEGASMTSPPAGDAGGTESGATMASPDPDPERLAAAAELRGLLEELIDALGPTYRTVFVLREIEGLSTGETAECLGISQEAVKVRLHRGKAILREQLSARAGLASPGAFPFLGARCDRMVRQVFVRLDLPLPRALDGSGRPGRDS